MSRDLRPVKSQWGQASSVFIDSEQVEELFREIFPDIQVDSEEQRECIVLEILNGDDFLSALENLTLERRDEISNQFKGVTKQDESDPFRGVDHLMHNLHNMATEWRGMLEGKVLTIWVD